MSTHLARYLKDFGTPPRVPQTPAFQPPSFAQDEGAFAAEAFAPPPAMPMVDLEAERASAFTEGKAEAEAALSAKYEAEIAALKEAHKAEFDVLKIRYERQYASALSDRFAAWTEEVSERVSAQAAQVLAPIMSQVLTRGAVSDLARMISEGLKDGDGLTITVKGPLDLFEQLKSHFEEPVPVFRHVEVQDVDLTVEFGDAVLVTRMSAWADTVRKVLA
ncbi:UNVERIFIED_ORG: hypothetical protein LHK14_05725 [Roseateles sp. XES5]|nr:hypothetical protein [Roseateles sp. XES5]